MKFEEIETDRLILRIVTPAVYDFIYTNFSIEEQLKFLGLSSKEELESEKQKYGKGLEMYNKSMVGFQMIDKTSQKVIGLCGFHTWYVEHRRAEIGYSLFDDAYKRKGFMSEALPPIIDYGFVTMNLHRIEAFISPHNTPSLKLVQKLNFSKEGILREHFFVNNKMEDSAVFSLLKKEWESP